MPAGKVPVLVTVGAGKPVVVTWNEKGVPTVALAVAALVIVGASLTFKVKVWLTVPRELVAVIVIE
jgi:hypothetical protein